MSKDSGLTTCPACGNDLSAEGGVTAYYRFAIPGRLDGDGMGLPHSVDELLANAADATQDAIVCAACDDYTVWEE